METATASANINSASPLVNGPSIPGVGKATRPGTGSARGGSRRTRMKNRGSQTYSSDEEDLHSDDNLRPYEEVKVSHHDKKLAGLGLTPDESAVSPIMPSTSNPNHKAGGRSGGRAYSYGSDEEAEARVPLQGKQPPQHFQQQEQQQQHPFKHPHAHQHQHPHPHPHAHPHQHLHFQQQPLQQHNPQQQQRLAQKYSHSQPDHVVYDPPWDHINFDPVKGGQCQPRPGQTSESDEDNRQALHRYSQAGTLPMPPPTFPPPPPPPIEDIPQRSPAPQRQRSFGPSMRGNYSDIEFRRQQFPGEAEHELENPYMVQNTLGATYSMDARYAHQRPPMHRSGSVPSAQSHGGMDGSDHYISSGHSDTYPYHCPNVGDGTVIVHNNDRQGLSYPQFGPPTSIPPGGSYPPSNDYRYYSKFSNAGNRMKKQLRQRCTWKCTALILLILCPALLACAIYFPVNTLLEEEKVEKDCSEDQPDPTSSRQPWGVLPNGQFNYNMTGHSFHGRFDPNGPFPTTPPVGSRERPTPIQVGKPTRKLVPPGAFWFSQLEQKKDGNVRLNLTVPSDAMMAVYGRRGLAPTHVQFDFFKVIDGSRVSLREKRAVQRGNDYVERDTALVEYMQQGNWYIGVYNDRKATHSVVMSADEQKMDSSCPNGCYGNGECRSGQCHCFSGYKGNDCSQNVCPLLCSGNGVYLKGQCQCNTGWKGPECALRESECAVPNCNGFGHCINGVCVCFPKYKGPDCGIEICLLDCLHGHCENQKCVCESGWAGALCNEVECDHRCDIHGYCNNGTCVCDIGWNGKHCTLNGCPGDCNGHGNCRRFKDGWSCSCRAGWKGAGCELAMETSCLDKKDNDHDGLIDCLDPDCCDTDCVRSHFCKAAPDPKDILLRKNAPSPTASFLEKMRFLIEENSVQDNAHRTHFNESQVSVIRGRVQTSDGTPLIGVHVAVVTQPLYGFTRTRKEGLFDILVNGGGSVTLEFVRDFFVTKTSSVLVPWNQIITMDTVVMSLDNKPELGLKEICGNVDIHDHYLLRPVVLSTWQHTQLGACPERSTIIPESQVIQESLDLHGTDVHLVYHSSESSGYKSLIMIQMTPEEIPHTLSVVHLRVTVEGVVMEKTFEADPNLKYTFAWDRLDAYKQKVYGIVTARVYVGYQYLNCDYVFWETRSSTLNGYDMTASHIGGWNLDIHHTYNYQEGILHKGDGTNIYLKEKPKKIITILGSGKRRSLTCNNDCNGKALDNRLLSPVALASGLDGSLYVGDYNLIRKLSPQREEIASILRLSTMTTPFKFYMTVSPVNGKLYISDVMSHKIIRVRTMGPVLDLEDNYEVVAGTGEECSPGEADACGDGGLAINAKLRHPKGIAISKDGIIYVADGPNIRKITPDGIITTIIGTQAQLEEWTHPKCDGSMPAEEVSLKWPTALAINPLDNTLHVVDDSIVLKLTHDFKLVTVAGRPPYCSPRQSSFLPSGVLNDDDQASNVANHVTLVSPKSITFGPNGDLYIVESNNHHINRVRVVSTDGHIHHFAGAKSKCDCSKENCICFDPKKTLAAQALFSDPTSATFTPDGVFHLADMGILRVFSVVSELPVLTNNFYEVIAPETQELYLFNRYGQHHHTINIHTGQYIYNFTYNIVTSYGRLMSVKDALGNKIEIKRASQFYATEIVTPTGKVCNLLMDNRHRLHKFISSDNSTSTFTYTTETGLVKSKQDSNGQTFLYRFDDNGRLLTIVQPTGQITTLTTDVNATGSIVRVATGTRHMSALATYGSVHSVLHGSIQTKVTYLPDGAVVVLFPSNLTVAIETGRGRHPVMDIENRMHYKRKIMVPGSSVHRLEWKFYPRRGSDRSHRVKDKLSQRMRVGDPQQPHVIVHGSVGQTPTNKGLLINGENLLTVQYDRQRHTETVKNKFLRDVIVVNYNAVGLPTHFTPTSSHHSLNISYNEHGDIVQWQYGELIETRDYLDAGLIKVRTLKPGGTQFRYFYRNNTRKPTDIFMPSGKQYQLGHDSHYNLKNITTPVLGLHHFNTLLTLGLKRFLYRAPSFSLPYIEDYDAMGKLLQVMYPSEQRRIMYRYNNLGERSLVMFDQTLIKMTYHPEAQHLSKAELVSHGYANTLTFRYLSTLVRKAGITFPQDSSLVGAVLDFAYDNHFRQTETTLTLTNNASLSSKKAFNQDTGKLSYVGGLSLEWMNGARQKNSQGWGSKQIFNNSKMVLTREYDGYGKLTNVRVNFNGVTKFFMEIDYDKIERVHEWKRLFAGDEVTVEYIYDVDSHVTDVLVQGQVAWEFGYDPNGNINKVTSQGTTLHMQYDVGDKITTYGSKVYKFDSDGFMAQRGLDLVTFNSAGLLVSVTRYDVFKFIYFYDALHRLAVQKDRFGRALQFFYCDMKNRHLITHVYNHTTGELTEYFRDSDGSLIGMQRRGQMYYIVVDPTQSPMIVFDSDGKVVKHMTYTPLGVQDYDSNPDFNLAFGFQSGFYNSMTRLVHFWNRVYDAELGRFLTPNYDTVFEKLKHVTKNPEILNLYSHRFLVNMHLRHHDHPRLDLSSWLNFLGYDIRSMAPDVSYTGDLNPGPPKPDMQLLPAASAFECTFRRDMHNLLTISLVPRSKVTPLQHLPSETPSPLSSIFGPGVTISNQDGYAVVNIVDVAQSWAKNLATVLLNSSQILPIHFTIRGKDVHYFLKPNVHQAEEDLRNLGIKMELVTYESGINVSVHRNQRTYSSSRYEYDVRIHGNHTVLNIRYGTTFDREMRRVLHHAKDRAVEHAWAREKHLLQQHLPSLYHWTKSEMRQIVSLGRVTGYVADYYHLPDNYPELSDDCNNIKFVAEVP